MKPLSVGEETFALHLKAHRIEFVREYRFHPTRKWRFDFLIRHPSRAIAVEIEGRTYGKGRHTSPRGFEADIVKYNQASRMGYTVLRYTTGMVTSGKAIREVLQLFESPVRD